MLVGNIFSLIHGKQEDQLSSSFGFILKNNRPILKKFLEHINIRLTEKELKAVDIETQTTYDSGESRIDLHLLIPNRFLIFLESKIVTAPKIDAQLLKYSKILNKNRGNYEGVRLVYVNKFPLRREDLEKLRHRLRLRHNEFFFFSWEDVLNLTSVAKNKETIKLFSNYIGDSMFSKKIIGEQKIKNVVDVLVVLTRPAFMEIHRRKNMAVQINGAPDAHYLAFQETGRPNGQRSAITHIAEVEYTENNVPRKDMLKGLPIKVQQSLLAHMKARNADLNGVHKQYVFKPGSFKKLAREIPSVGAGPMVKYKTTMGDLLRAETTKDLRKKKVR